MAEAVRSDPSALTVEVAAAALALEGEDGATELLAFSDDADFVIRSAAAFGLKLLGPSARWAVPLLIRSVAAERVPYVTHIVANTLGHIGGAQAGRALGELLAHAAERGDRALVAAVRQALVEMSE